jgi:hypothetical protein
MTDWYFCRTGEGGAEKRAGSHPPVKTGELSAVGGREADGLWRPARKEEIQEVSSLSSWWETLAEGRLLLDEEGAGARSWASADCSPDATVDDLWELWPPLCVSGVEVVAGEVPQRDEE